MKLIKNALTLNEQEIKRTNLRTFVHYLYNINHKILQYSGTCNYIYWFNFKNNNAIALQLTLLNTFTIE